ncbi:MAG: hypothetical protein OXK82_00440 [Deltaproteobacteria bacterium]|nr:hypothetical protein [Deltaproteobacteria bacterium]
MVNQKTLDELVSRIVHVAQPEKVMILRGIDFPYIHDLAHLMTVLEARGEQIPDAVRRAARLTYFAVDARTDGVLR